MKKYWFKKFGWIFYPVSWQGYLITIIDLAFCVHVFLFVDSHSHSVSDTLYGLFPYIIPALLLLDWIASRTSKN